MFLHFVVFKSFPLSYIFLILKSDFFLKRSSIQHSRKVWRKKKGEGERKHRQFQSRSQKQMRSIQAKACMMHESHTWWVRVGNYEISLFFVHYCTESYSCSLISSWKTINIKIINFNFHLHKTPGSNDVNLLLNKCRWVILFDVANTIGNFLNTLLPRLMVSS